MRVSSGQGIALAAQYTGAGSAARWSAQERAQVYQRVMTVPGGSSAGGTPNTEFNDLFLRYVSSVSQFAHRDGQPLVAAAETHRALFHRAAHEASSRLGPLIVSARDARDQWQVIDEVAGLELGGAVNHARFRSMAESGGAILETLALRDNQRDTAPFVDDALLQAADHWIAAACTCGGEMQALAASDPAQRVAAWSQALHQAVGLGDPVTVRHDLRTAKPVALFSGPPGTGKTLAAHWLASSLGRDLYRVDMERAISKYIGETEKNLDAIFEDARSSGAVLLFDEAEALLGKRSEVRDSHDRYANLEVSYLLQRIESHEGLTILASNAGGQIDPDALKRVNAVVAFPVRLR